MEVSGNGPWNKGFEIWYWTWLEIYDEAIELLQIAIAKL